MVDGKEPTMDKTLHRVATTVLSAMNHEHGEAVRIEQVNLNSTGELLQPMIAEQTTELRKTNEQLEAINQELQREINRRKLLEQKLGLLNLNLLSVHVLVLRFYHCILQNMQSCWAKK